MFSDDLNRKLAHLLYLAGKLPTGATDPRALTKLQAERQELLQAVKVGDLVEALLEAADVTYYAVKAWHSDLHDVEARDLAIEMAAKRIGLPVELVIEAALLKYAQRALPGNPKRPAVEYIAAWALMIGGDGSDDATEVELGRASMSLSQAILHGEIDIGYRLDELRPIKHKAHQVLSSRWNRGLCSKPSASFSRIKVTVDKTLPNC